MSIIKCILNFIQRLYYNAIHCNFALTLNNLIMAIEIKRTPVLEGKAAQAFIRSVETNRVKVSSDRVRHAVNESKKILESSRVKKC